MPVTLGGNTVPSPYPLKFEYYSKRIELFGLDENVTIVIITGQLLAEWIELSNFW